MRDNEDRLGALPNIQAGPTVPVQTAQNQPLNFTVPTEIIDLPSKGLLYPDGHPLKNKQSVEIKFMTAKEEDLLTSKALIKKGVAIDRMLESLLVDKSVKVENMLIGDKNALIVAARISGYGSSYKTTVVCPACNANVKHEFKLSEVKNHFCHNPEEFGAVLTPNLTYTIILPKTGFTVEVKPLLGSDETALIELAEKKKKMNLPEETSTSQMKTYVVSVNGNTDKNSISQFIQNMPALDARSLRTLYKELMPSVDMTQQFVCSSCSFEQEMEVPFTVDFFWPK